MKAVTISKNGGPEVLELKDIKLPDPKSDEVLIKNKAIGLNYIDTYHRSGLYPVELPSNIGIEGSGIIEKTGSEVKNFKIRGSSGKLNIALDDLPNWKSIPAGDPAGTGDMHITQTIEEMEGAYDDWKDGRWSQFPYVDMCIPSINDPTMAPQGKHYMSVFIQYVPYNLAEGGWTEEKRLEFGKHVMSRIGNYSTNFNDIISWVHFVDVPEQKCFRFTDTNGNTFVPDEQSTGDLICFPSWSWHEVLPNKTDHRRLIISGNISVTHYD